MRESVRSRIRRRAVAFAAVSALAVGGVASIGIPAVAAMAQSGPITSPGPLTAIDTTRGLACQVRYNGVAQFYGASSCYTSVASGGSVMGGLGSAWTPTSQELTGAGSKSDPFVLTTVVVGDGWEVTKVDRYVSGKGDYDSEVRVTNTTGSDREAVVSHAADCYLQGGDVGYGAGDSTTGAATCLKNPPSSTDPGQVESFIPKTDGGTFGYGAYNSVYAAVRAGEPMGNRMFTPGATAVDNGMGISWSRTVAAGATEVLEWQNHFLTGEEPQAETSADGALVDTDRNGRPDAGETVSYVVTVHNTGNVPLQDAAIGAPRGIEFSCPPMIAVDATESCTTDVPVQLDQSDIDAGAIRTDFTLTAKTPRGASYTGVPTPADVPLAGQPGGETATLAIGDVPAAGATLHVTSTITNTGNVTLSDLSATVNGAAVDCAGDELAPGASTECVTDHVVTQDEFDSGQLLFRTEATAKTPGGASAALAGSEDVAAFDRRGALETALRTTVADGAPGVGQDIGLRMKVKNTGNASVKDIEVAIDGDDGFQVDCSTPSLAPGASLDCEVAGSHTVTQEDVDRGAVPFHAAVRAVDTAGAPVTDEASTSQETVAQAPVISATVLPELRSEAGAAPVAGDVVALTVRATNAGNVTLHDVAGAIADREGLDVACPVDVLAPGERADCTVPEYALTQEDVDNGEVVFDATVSAVDPKDQPVEGSDTARVTVDRQHGIVATATAQLADGHDAPKAGDRVELSVLARNSGNTTLHGFTAELGDEDLDATCADRPVAPGDEVTCSVSDHVLTQAEVDAGIVDFDVEVTADAPGGQRPTAKDSVSVELARVPSVDLTATSVLDPSEHEVPLAGDTARVAMTIRNTGNVTVTGVRGAVAEREGLDVVCPEDELAPGQRVVCEVSEYTLTQGDVDRGQIQFDVEGTATGANRQRVTAHASTTLTVVRAPAIQTSAVSALDSTDREHASAGDTATVRLTIENVGNVTVRDLAGAVIGRDDMVASCSTAALAPGKSAECTLPTYTLVQSDVDAGKVGFEISGSATGADGQRVGAEAKTGFDIDRLPAVVTRVVAHLAASDHDTPRAGDRIEVAVHARNSGNVTLDHASAEIVELADLPVTCPATGFTPGTTLECAVPDYVLTQADIDHGRVGVAAVLDAVGPGGTVVTHRDEVRVGLTAKSVLDLSAEAVTRDSAGVLHVLEEGKHLRPGSNVLVRYTIVNTGNLVIDDVQQAADMPELSVEQTRLLPGERTTALTTEAHTVTDAEAAAEKAILVGQVQGTVSRADGETVEDAGAATVGQTGTERSERAEQADPAAEPQRVLSNQVRITIPTERAPIELAFTGTEITQVVLPAGLVLFLAGCVLLLWTKRRRRESTDERNA